MVLKLRNNGNAESKELRQKLYKIVYVHQQSRSAGVSGTAARLPDALATEFASPGRF